jgi:hypothetical protein
MIMPLLHPGINSMTIPIKKQELGGASDLDI